MIVMKQGSGPVGDEVHENTFVLSETVNEV